MEENLNKIVYVGTGHTKSGDVTNIYEYKFTTGKHLLDVDDGSTYGGISHIDETYALIREAFAWELIKFVYKYDLDTPEGFYNFMKKFNPDYVTTLEELKENWDKNILDIE